MKQKLIIFGVVGAILLGGFLYMNRDVSGTLGSLSVCTVTESKVAIGHQAATTVVSAGARSWAVIQQPVNATNTASLSIGGTAVAGSGYGLAAAASTASSTPDKLVLGFATDLPTSAAVSGITNFGSTTINAIVCR